VVGTPHKRRTQLPVSHRESVADKVPSLTTFHICVGALGPRRRKY